MKDFLIHVQSFLVSAEDEEKALELGEKKLRDGKHVAVEDVEEY